MSGFKIVCAQGRAGPTFFQLLEFLKQALALLLVTCACEQESQIVEPGFAVRFGVIRLAKDGDCFGVLFLLRKNLSEIDV